MNMSQLRKCGNKTYAFTGEAKVCIIWIQQRTKTSIKTREEGNIS
jgi:hypothetical protein